jgi:glutathione S-transferase
MKLIISNKATSPWPMRAWLVMRAFDIPFHEELVDLSQPNKKELLKVASPSGRVPALVDGDVTVWESLAIIEYLAERYPDKAIWPVSKEARAHARSVANEVHAGFAALRRNCVFNLRKEPAAAELTEDAKADIARIIHVWTDTHARFGTQGPFLYGQFSAADAMHAPLVARFRTYRIDVPADALPYMAAVEALPAWSEWVAAAVA